MNALSLLVWLVSGTIILLSTELGAQTAVAVNYQTLSGETGSGKMNLPLYAMPHDSRTIFYPHTQGEKLILTDMQTVTFAGDTLFRRFPEFGPEHLWQLLLWGETYHLYRSVDRAEDAEYVLYHKGQAQHLHAKNYAGVLNRERPWQTQAVINKDAPFTPARLVRATRQLNDYREEGSSYVYTPFELSRWQLETGIRVYLQSPYILSTVRKSDFGVAYQLGLNYRPFTHLPYFWAHSSFSRQAYDGDHTAIAWRQPDYLRSLQFTEWQWAMGARIEAAPQWGLSPYIGLNIIFTLPTGMTYIQELAPDRSQPSELPFRIEQSGQSKLSAGPGFTFGLRIQMGDYSSFHLQYQSENINRRVNFNAPEGSSRLAVDGNVKWNQFAQQVLAAHLQFRIR